MSTLTFVARSTAEVEWAGLLSAYLADLKSTGRYAPKTVERVKYHLSKVTAFWAHVSLTQLDVADGEALLSHYERTFTGPPLVELRRYAMRLLDWACERGWVAGNVVDLALRQRTLDRQRDEREALEVEWSWAEEAYRAWLLQHQVTAGTIKNYLGAVRSLRSHVATADPWSITPAQFHDFFEAFAEGKYAARRRNVAAFYDWAVQDGHVPVNAARTLLNQRHRQRKIIAPAWTEAIEHYMDHLAAGHRVKGTRGVRLRHLRALAEACAPAGPWTLQPRQLIAFVGREGMAATTRRSLRSSVSGFYDWATRTGRVRHNPARDLPTVRVPRARPRPAPDPYIESVLLTAEPRLRLMLLLGACAGLRANEIATLHTGDIDSYRKQLHVTGKGGVQRVVPMHPLVEQHLVQWLGRREGHVFPGRVDGHLSGHYVSRVVGRALPPGWTAHTLRHRFASVGYAATRDLRAMQELLGHASPATTAIYTAVTDVALAETVAAVGLNAAAPD